MRSLFLCVYVIIAWMNQSSDFGYKNIAEAAATSTFHFTNDVKLFSLLRLAFSAQLIYFMWPMQMCTLIHWFMSFLKKEKEERRGSKLREVC